MKIKRGDIVVSLVNDAHDNDFTVQRITTGLVKGHRYKVLESSRGMLYIKTTDEEYWFYSDKFSCTIKHTKLGKILYK